MGAIATAQNNLITSTGEEQISYKVYDKDGNFIDTHNENVMIEVPARAIPIGRDLTVEYLRPVKKVIQEVSLKNINVSNSNPIFNYGGYRFNEEDGEVVEATSGIPSLSGTHVYRNAESEVRAADTVWNQNLPTILWQNLNTDASVRAANSTKIGFSYYVDNTDTGAIDYYFHISVYVVHPDSNEDDIQWNFKENKWEQTASYNTDDFHLMIRNKTKGKWQNWSKTFPPVIVDGEEFNQFKYVVYGTCYEDSGQEGNHVYTYFDNIYIASEVEDASKFVVERENDSSDTITGVYEDKDLLLSNDLGASTIYDQGFDGNFYTRKNGSTQTYKLDELISQEKLNDYRSFVKRFEGTFLNANPQPIPVALFNKIWFNFVNQTESVTAYIDSMDYSLKKNNYRLVMHIPNQDDDVSSTYQVAFE